VHSSYGQLNDLQREAVRPYLQGKVVYDLGAGDLLLSVELLALGALRVEALDKAPMPKPTDSRINTTRAYFEDYFGRPISTSFLSWPANRDDFGLFRLVEQSDTVIYLGKNTDMTACGSPALFKRFLKREVLEYLPAFKNTLIVYGPRRVSGRKPLGEEFAGIYNQTWFSYEQVEAQLDTLPAIEFE